MSAVVTNIGEEWYSKYAGDGSSVNVGLYNDSTDAAGKTTDVGDLTTEPSGSAYARQAATLASYSESSDWGPVIDSQASFDVSDSSQDVDAWFLTATFTSEEVGDSGDTEHLIATGFLSQTRNLADLDGLNLEAQSVGFLAS